MLEADAVIVGSGAGGGVIAARLAEAGLKVIVLEAGGYFNEADFDQTELNGFGRMYWRGGPTYTADYNVSLQAGSCLGGGTVINWTNCLQAEALGAPGMGRRARPDRCQHPRLRPAHRFGLASDPGQRRMLRPEPGPADLDRRGREARLVAGTTTNRNWDPSKYEPRVTGLMGWGDQSGAKQSTLKTYLQDAVDAGAEVIVGCLAEKVLVEDGRAAGVEANCGGGTSDVRAPRVVVAGGALESPALLLRSGIGGPATGKHLRLHPCTLIFADYGEDQKAWWGAPHAAVIDEFDQGLDDDGYGFLIEGAQYTTGLGGSAIPFTTAEAHRELMAGYANGVTTIIA